MDMKNPRCNAMLVRILAKVVMALARRMAREISFDNYVIDLADDRINVILPNHKSYFDAFLICALTYTRYGVWPTVLASSHFRDNRWFAFFVDRLNAIYIDRDDLSKQTIRQLGLLKKGDVLLYFPEGRRVTTGKRGEVKLRLLKCLRQDVAITPVSIVYGILPEEHLLRREQWLGRKTPMNELTLPLIRWVFDVWRRRRDIEIIKIQSGNCYLRKEGMTPAVWYAEVNSLDHGSRWQLKAEKAADIHELDRRRVMGAQPARVVGRQGLR